MGSKGGGGGTTFGPKTRPVLGKWLKAEKSGVDTTLRPKFSKNVTPEVVPPLFGRLRRPSKVVSNRQKWCPHHI